MRAQKYNKTLLYLFSVYLYIVLSIFYYIFLIDGRTSIENKSALLQGVANFHDHFIYIDYIRHIKTGDLLIGLNNNWGISLFYSYLSDFFHTDNYLLLAHIVNSLFFVLLSFLVYKVFKQLNFSIYFSIFFILNPANFYYTELINKDIITIVFVFLFIDTVLNRKYLLFIFFLLVSGIIRMQLPLFGLVLWFLLNYRAMSMMKKLLIIYLVSAVLGVLTEHFVTLISMDRMGSSLGFGVGKIVRTLNMKYYIGSLLLNPIRAMQYYYDYISGFGTVFNSEYLMFIRVKDVLNILFLVFSTIVIAGYFYTKPKEFHSGVYVFLTVVFAFFAVWLINPTINYRYFAIFVPFVIVSGMQIFFIYRRKIER